MKGDNELDNPDGERREMKEEDFLNVPACPFRRVSYGTTFCTISTDAFVAEVDPLTCLNCDVYSIISAPRCRFLSLGTELKPFRGEGRLVIAMACKELGIRIYNLNTCNKCKLYSEVPSIVDEVKYKKLKAEVQLQLPPEVVAQIAAIAGKERARGEFAGSTEEPHFSLGCWRFEDGVCRKSPVYARGKTTVILTRNPRNDEIYDRAIRPALKEMNLTVYRLSEEMDNPEEICRACENMQESDFIVTSLDEWSSNTIFLLGLVHGMGRRIAVLKRNTMTALPLLDVLAPCIVEYDSLPEIIFLLKHRFSPLIKHAQEREG
jgi:hypothetical protein